MSDDRDKYHELREYLRNNKPKRSLDNDNINNIKFDLKANLNDESNLSSDTDNDVNLNNNSNSKSKANSIILEKELKLDNHSNNDVNLKDNLNPNNLNLDNSSNSQNQKNTQILDNKNSNKRDYDKEPLIIKNYEKFFVYNLFVFPFLFALTVALTIRDLFDKNESLGGIAGFSIVMIFFLVFEFATTYKLYVENSDSKICFKNNCIEFYDEFELKSVTYVSNIENYMCKPFFTNWHLQGEHKTIKYVIMTIFLCLAIVGEYTIVLIMLFICFYIGILIVKILVFYKINENLKGFTPFLSIIVDKPKSPDIKSAVNATIFNSQYYSIYILNKNDYLKIKKYFLIRKNINIDKIRKEYLGIWNF